MDDQMLDERITALLRGDVGQPDSTFVDGLRRDLAAEIDGRPRAFDVAPIDRVRRRRALPWLAGGLAAAAAAAAIIVVTRDDRSHRVVPADPTEVSTPADVVARFEVGADTPAVVPVVTELAALDGMPFPTASFQRDGSLLAIDASTYIVRLIRPDGTVAIDASLPEQLRGEGGFEHAVAGPDEVIYISRGEAGLDAWAAGVGGSLELVAHWNSDVCVGSCRGGGIDRTGSRVIADSGISGPGVAFVDPRTGEPSGATSFAVPEVRGPAIATPHGLVDTVIVDGVSYEVTLLGFGTDLDGPTLDLWSPQPDGSVLRGTPFPVAGGPIEPRLLRITAEGELVVLDLSPTEVIGSFTGEFGAAPDGSLRALTLRDGVTHLVRIG